MSAPTAKTASPFKQPKAVWAVAFACVISFMGIGLVDPILPALADSLHATPSQVSLLFSSYLIVTAVAMLVVGWFSSRFGAKRTLVIGLSVIVVFSALAGATGSINGIVGFRAGFGGSATRCSSPPPWPSSSPRRAAASVARSSSTRPRSASGSPSGRCSAASWGRSAGAAPSSASPS